MTLPKQSRQKTWKKGSVCVDDDGNVYVGDCVNYCVRKITPDGTVTTLAGLAGNKGCIDGTGVQARFNGLYGMDCDAEGNIIHGIAVIVQIPIGTHIVHGILCGFC